MEILQQLKQAFSSKCMVEVVWDDITTKLMLDKNAIDNSTPESFLEECTTYGIVYKLSEKTVILATETSNTAIDITTIPISIIKSIKGGR